MAPSQAIWPLWTHSLYKQEEAIVYYKFRKQTQWRNFMYIYKHRWLKMTYKMMNCHSGSLRNAYMVWMRRNEWLLWANITNSAWNLAVMSYCVIGSLFCLVEMSPNHHAENSDFQVGLKFLTAGPPVQLTLPRQNCVWSSYRFTLEQGVLAGSENV